MHLFLILACAHEVADTTGTDTGFSDTHHLDLPSHNECLPTGEKMSAEVCIAVVEDDGRYPGVSENKSHTDPDANDPRLTDPDYQWLLSEVERCACVCCHNSEWGGPGTYFWDVAWSPMWIDSASNWSLSVLGGWTNEEDQTLPADDLERLQALLEYEMDRRQEAN